MDEHRPGGIGPLVRWLAAAAGLAVFVIGLVVAAVFVDQARRDSGRDIDGRVATTASLSSVGEPAADEPPDEVAQRFLAAWSGSDWEALRNLVGDPHEGVDDVLAGWQADLDVASVAFQTDAAEIAGGVATVPLHVSVEVGGAGMWTYESQLRLLQGADGWRVDWSAETLHPDLSSGDALDLDRVWSERGRIMDKDDRDLVVPVPGIVVGLVPERVVSRADIAAAFESTLGLEPSVVDDVLDRPGVQPDWFLPVATLAREENVQVRPALYPIPGVAFRLIETRSPIDSRSLATLVGTVGEITAEQLAELGAPYVPGLTAGRSGLEAAFERRLAGEPTTRVVRRSADGSVSVIHSFESVAGSDVQTTLSLAAQRAAEAAIDRVDTPASIVAIDAATGEIRAVASTPNSGHNRALSGLYAPGSTFKIIVATALLESGLKPTDSVACPRTVDVAGKTFRNASSMPATMTFEKAFARSCNTAFIQLAAELDHVTILETASRFGFGGFVEIGVPAADPSLPAPTDAVDAAASAIGQGKVLASPLNMAAVAATAANGSYRPPTLIRGEGEDASARLDPAVLADLQQMMSAVVAEGTGTEAAVDGRIVAGKTGTAQVGTAEGSDSVAWFVGFADGLAFAVAVEGGASGGAVAAPIAADFLERLDRSKQGPGLDECVAAGADWVTFQGDATRSGCSLAPALAEPRRLWQAEVGMSGWLNSPIVVGDTVVIGSAGTRRAGSDPGDGVYALDLRTGAERWFFPAASDVNGVAARGDLVVATGDEGTVWGLDITTGSLRWSFSATTPVFTNPLVVDDLIIVGDASGVVRALDLDGQQRWWVRLDGAIRGGAASDGQVIYAVSERGDAVALSTDGFELWRSRIEYSSTAWGRPEGAPPLPVTVFAPPTLDRDHLVVSFVVDGGPGGPAAVALDRFVGTLTWWGSDPNDVHRGTNVRTSPARYGDVLVLASSLSAGVQAVDSASGQVLWATESGVQCTRQWASPVVLGDTLVLPRPDGALHAYDAETGETVWRFVPSAGGEFPPFTGCTGGGVRVQDGFELQASVAVAPDGTLIVASMSQFVYAIGEA